MIINDRTSATISPFVSAILLEAAVFTYFSSGTLLRRSSHAVYEAKSCLSLTSVLCSTVCASHKTTPWKVRERVAGRVYGCSSTQTHCITCRNSPGRGTFHVSPIRLVVHLALLLYRRREWQHLSLALHTTPSIRMELAIAANAWRVSDVLCRATVHLLYVAIVAIRSGPYQCYSGK